MTTGSSSRAVLAGVLAAVALSGSAVGAGPRAASSAAPLARAWAEVPETAAARKAANVVVMAIQGDVNAASPGMGIVVALRGAYFQNYRGEWVKDLVTAAKATKQGVTYTISPRAFWYWGGRKLPVTYRDFVYTLQQIDDPNNHVAGRGGYANLDPSGWEHSGERQVTFFWRTSGCSTDFPCRPYANWRLLFGSLYPAEALNGLDFNTIWTDCICGSDGKPVANGPFYQDSYTPGQGAVLKRNPFWGGRRQKLDRIYVKPIINQDLLVDEMMSGTVDAIIPSLYGTYLDRLKNAPGLIFDQVPGYGIEHLAFREGKGSSNPLLRAPWMRQAIGLAINRQALIDAAYGPASRLPLRDSLLYSPKQADYRPDFARWNFNPAKALALLKAHCTGGPSTPNRSTNKVWQCSGFPATFHWTWNAENAMRTQFAPLAKADLKSVGIELIEWPLPFKVMFSPAEIPGGNFDIVDFAWRTGIGDPENFEDVFRCGGGQNYMGYCSHTVDGLLGAADGEVNPARRAELFRRADAILATEVPAMPLYSLPDVLIYKKDLAGMHARDPFDNVEDVHWKR